MHRLRRGVLCLLILCIHLYTCLLCGLDARVNNGIEDVRQQVPHNYGNREQDCRGLDDGIVSITDSNDRSLADARDVEDVLDEKYPGDEQANREAKDRNERYHGIA